MKQDVGGVQLSYEIHGDVADNKRPWVVFSHSLACTSRMWDPQIDTFSGAYRVLLFDTRGHGDSDCPAEPYTMDLLARDAYRLLSARGISRAHFVGLSMGGMIGQTLALEHPGLVATLTLADTASEWPADAVQVFADRVEQARTDGMDALVDATLGRWFTPGFHLSQPDKVAGVGDMIRQTPVDGYAGCSHAIPRIALTSRLGAITCPTLVMVGREDVGTPPVMARQIHDNIPGSEYVEIADASHLSNIEQAAAFNATLANFLERNATPEPQA